MKANVLAENLSKAMVVVVKGISSRSQLPILTNVLLRVTKTGIELMSTDLEISFVVKIGAKVLEEGEILIPARVFNELVATLTGGPVELTVEKQVLKLHGDGMMAEIMGQAADDYPVIPRFSGKGITIDATEFKKKITRVAVSAAKDNTRPVLEGILWQINKTEIVLAATDGYRLGTDKLTDIGGETIGEVSMVLPARAVLELIKTMSENESKIGIEFDGDKQQVIFKVGDLEMASRLIGGDFPPFMQIIPKDFEVKIVINRDSLVAAVRRSSIFARGNANIVTVQLLDGKLQVSASSSELGNNVSEVIAEAQGDSLKMAFNGKYLLEYLGTTDADEIVLESAGDLKPGVFKMENSDFLHIIMPIRQNTD